MTASARVVVPTCSEAGNIREIVAEILSKTTSLELLVVDDDSQAGTGRLAEERVARASRLHVLHRPGKEVLGKSCVVGFGWALDRDDSWVIQMEADFSHDPADVPRLVGPKDRGELAIVFVDRRVGQSKMS